MKKFFICTILVLYFQISYGQDMILSQYFASQPYINPALTGFFDGSYRVTANYRSQWNTLGSSIKSMGVSADAVFLKDKLQGDYLGIGVSAYREDQFGYISNNMGRLNFSYNKKIGYEREQYLSIGTYLGANHNFLGGNFDITPDGSPEEIQRTSTIGFDVGLGLNYQIVFSDNANFFIGGSLDHILPIKNSFLNTNAEKARRFNLYTSAKIRITDLVYVLPTLLASKQDVHTQINAGTSVQFLFGNYTLDKSSISIGTFLRYGNNSIDAAIGMARLEYKGVMIGLSYDHNMNELSTATKGFGALELSLGYIGLVERVFKSRSDCPNTKNF
jgi:type IX secretion system PorP/SprF family membrane protein